MKIEQLVLGSRKALHKEKNNWKATLRRSLELGFSSDTSRDLQIDAGSYTAALLYYNADPATENEVYMQLLPQGNEDSYRIGKAGKFSHLECAPFFEKLGADLNIDFVSQRYIYEIEAIEIEGHGFFKLTGRKPKGQYAKKQTGAQ